MQLPGPLRAAVGLVVSVVEEARHLPDRAIELPMLAVSTALQASLRAQQRYAGLTAKGDEVLNRRTPNEEPPAWATFDEPVPVDQLRRDAMHEPSGADPDASQVLDELFGVEDPAVSVAPPAPLGAEPTPPQPEWAEPVLAKQDVEAKAPAKKKSAAKKAAAVKTVAAKRAAPAKKTAAAKKTAPDTSAAGSAVTANSDADSGKRVSKPRHAPPSAFDNVDD